MEEFGEDVWSPVGVKILGTPVGSLDFVESVTEERLEKEQELWRAIPSVPDLQCAWQLLFQCAGPRCHHFLRTVPPTQSRVYAEGHDRGMQEVMARLLGGLLAAAGSCTRRGHTTHAAGRFGSPFRVKNCTWRILGVVGRRIAHDTSSSACHGQCRDGGFGRQRAELQESTRVLDANGFIGRPSWTSLRAGARPPPPTVAEPGEWQHGWQYYASSSLEHHFRETVVFVQSSAADLAHLRSHAGPGASAAICGAPTGPEFTLSPPVFRTMILERLRLPLDIAEARCECGGFVDSLGRHRAACPRSGRLRSRAVAPERTLARICREAGAVVRCNVKLREMNVTVAANDEREVEVLASGLPLEHGAQLAVDVTLRSAVTASGRACPNAAVVDGVVANAARRDKERKYAELVEGLRCKLVVVAIETGGRWSAEACNFVENLAWAKSREVAPVLQRSAFSAWRRRWTRMLSVSCCRAFAGSLDVATLRFVWGGWSST